MALYLQHLRLLKGPCNIMCMGLSSIMSSDGVINELARFMIAFAVSLPANAEASKSIKFLGAL